MAAQKVFNSSDDYTRSITSLLPAHALMREIAIASLLARAPERGTLGVVGSGPGDELIALAAAFPTWNIIAFEPAEAMAHAATERLRREGLHEQVRVIPRALQRGESPDWDAAISLMVTHFIAPGSDRHDFWQAWASHLRPGAPWVLSEIVTSTPEERRTWVQWSRQQGCSDEQLTRLDARLAGNGFYVLPEHDTVAMAEKAGLTAPETLLRVLGVRMWCGTRG
ncbi:class I SAM-dependent methyltransferase [Lujinxingia sediminis]|uniref:Class I SAM-dependent methyltransferase n=1 Tax=Lujinxingia sediminis TaxID=2480984 RepID=A0ABY0CWX9_9DELT|nr:class I SAM-dependent methyltransferase [Lujinxingia sediminis]RVU48130.1 class I SAM-dependent methyltransferase [Lujinxingia sediminis]